MKIGSHLERIPLLVTDLGKSDIFLGHDWIEHHNPVINWKNKDVQFNRCPTTCQHITDAGDRTFRLDIPSWIKNRNVHIRAKTSVAMEIAIEQNTAKLRKRSRK